MIGLERIGRLDILHALFDAVIIPPEVAKEFGGSFSGLQIETLKVDTLAASLGLLVDAGEAAAIALASEMGPRLIADDKQARPAAKQIGVEVIGTVGILIKAKKTV